MYAGRASYLVQLVLLKERRGEKQLETSLLVANNLRIPRVSQFSLHCWQEMMTISTQVESCVEPEPRVMA